MAHLPRGLRDAAENAVRDAIDVIGREMMEPDDFEREHALEGARASVLNAIEDLLQEASTPYNHVRLKYSA